MKKLKIFLTLLTPFILAMMSPYIMAKNISDNATDKLQNKSPSKKPIVVILLGAPGSGKGTQAIQMAKQLEIPHISTGDILRANVKQGTMLGKEAKEYMDTGKLVPDSLVSKMLFARIAEPDAIKGYILDGYPRTIAQAQELDKQLGDKAKFVVINLAVKDEQLIARIINRANEKPGEKRSDDTSDIIKKRLEVYHEQTEPVIEYYQKKGILINVDGEKKPDEVFKAIMSAYQKEMKV